MKNFTFKLLQQLNKKKADKGFTLIELLVVIIIIGILSAIALPAFLNQAAKARQSEAKQALASLNKAQQAYYLEEQEFSDTIGRLGLGLSGGTENYSYGATAANAAGAGNANFDTTDSDATIFAISSDQQAVRDYVAGAVIFTEDGNTTTTTGLCEENDATFRTAAAATTADITLTPTATTPDAAVACANSDPL
ncbi:hypothetical protein AWQ21_14105 [Picosynechococcus sp. PCC 7003]|uniref:type IV pilin-like G/H family protein n=1 Tax=Picosynechococcus sp. PCC 7003 TaxID=374981 RepID=UPI0008109A55|nr:type IV pilin-like G/H family protein [Picosynechococcus sp. PCC 7003]ANV85718.1 hypothetical protein AWQ21_14105 [Picosynechococcus sp. PCC 7003]